MLSVAVLRPLVGTLRRDFGRVLGTRCFALSAPGKIVAEHFGFDPAQVIAEAK